MLHPTKAMILLALVLTGATNAPAQESDGKAEVIALYQQAEKLKASGKVREAAALYEKAVAGALVAYGKDDASTRNLVNNLAGLYEGMHEYAKAEPLYRRRLEIDEARLGKGNPEVANSLNTLANLY